MKNNFEMLSNEIGIFIDKIHEICPGVPYE